MAKPKTIPDNRQQKLFDLWEKGRAISENPANSNATLGFMARSLLFGIFPYSDPGDVQAWGRSVGRGSVTMQPGTYIGDDGTAVKLGLPYGLVPRLVLIWLTTQAVRTKQREIDIGDCISAFMQFLDLPRPTGGERGSITTLKDQCQRLFAARFIAHARNDEMKAEGLGFMQLSDHFTTWMDPSGSRSWTTTIRLNDRFFDFLTERPVPIDRRAVQALRHSPMAMDVYCWLTYRMALNSHAEHLSWQTLMDQFGTKSFRMTDFRKQFKKRLADVMAVYPDARAELCDETGLTLLPGKPHVPKLVSGISLNTPSKGLRR